MELIVDLPFGLQQPRLPKAVVPVSRRIGIAVAADDVIQQWDVYGCARLTQLPGELNVGRTGITAT